jgi:hypothetical protein
LEWVFSGFLAKKVMCHARDSVFVHLDGTKWWMGLKSKQLVVGGTGLLGLVVRGAIQRNGGSLEGFYVFKPIYIYIYLKFIKDCS